MDLEKYRSIMSQTMLQTYLGIIEKLNVDYEHYDILSRIISTYPSDFDKKMLINDPVVVLFLLLRDTDCTQNELVDLFHARMDLCKIKERPKLVRKFSEESISDVMSRYIQLTPKRITKNISDDDISDISRRGSVDSMQSPVVNY